eukprot:12302230-Alexandrium_andersonii.AAC.1
MPAEADVPRPAARPPPPPPQSAADLGTRHREALPACRPEVAGPSPGPLARPLACRRRGGGGG